MNPIGINKRQNQAKLQRIFSMSVQTKNVSGQLLDMERKNILADVSVVINLVQPKNLDDRPHYEVSATVKGYKPELADKSHILKINEIVSGEVFIYISGIPNTTQTRFKVNLQDSAWNSLQWFQAL
jgi:hypothetical protein